MITRTVATRTATVAVALTLSAVLAGCASSTSPTSSAPPATASSPATSSTAPAAQTHNRADITFATEMIPHHAQAVSMSALAARQASSPRVKDLAARIEAAQQPEIDQMSGWLRAWDAPVPDTDAPGTGGMSGMAHGDTSQNSQPGMSHGSGAMPGMMSQQQTHQLSQANGAAFDTMFLQMMIGHHQGAVTMSQTELADGENPDAKTLAQSIITAQQREITEKQTMLAHG
ncbi:MAG: copper resistance protein [Pseudonocardia sp.]|nr:copper resistance protein [Pseudonocardia sp.]